MHLLRELGESSHISAVKGFAAISLHVASDNMNGLHVLEVLISSAP
jgi:hypothetical protein